VLVENIHFEELPHCLALSRGGSARKARMFLKVQDNQGCLLKCKTSKVISLPDNFLTW